MYKTSYSYLPFTLLAIYCDYKVFDIRCFGLYNGFRQNLNI